MPDSFPFTMTLRLLGEKGFVEYLCQGEQTDLGVPAKNDLIVYPCGKPAWYQRDCPGKEAYLAEIEYFVNCLEHDIEPELATLAEAHTVLQIAMAVRRSLETGQVIAL